MNKDCQWPVLEEQLAMEVASTVKSTLLNIVQKYYSDLETYFSFQRCWRCKTYVADNTLYLSADYGGASSNSILKFTDDELRGIQCAIAEKSIEYSDRLELAFGDPCLSEKRFCYVGPYINGKLCWPDIHDRSLDWFERVVLPHVIDGNRVRILRAIPPAPTYSPRELSDDTWILECDQTCKQGSAFFLNGTGLVTCEHVLGTETYAFRHDDPSTRFKVNILHKNAVIDLAVLHIDYDESTGLNLGDADTLEELDHLAIFGYPIYRIGDTGSIVPGIVVGFRTVSAIRRILTNAPIVAGSSGGPVVDSSGLVVGVAITGADRMEEVQDTENHGIVPINALSHLNCD